MPANKNQLQTALKKPYDRILFAKEVLNSVFGSGFALNNALVAAAEQPNKTEKTVIDTVYVYGTITLEDDKEITCYEINLQPSVRIEQSKVAIQKYIRKLLTTGQGALVNFISPENKQAWRFTLIAKDSELGEEGVKEKITNAKRYTYLLGPAESCRTAAERLETLSTEKDLNFDALIKAFSVEKLSDAFFDEYTLHYESFCHYLQQSNFRKSVFNISFPPKSSQEEIDKACKPIRDFVKKLLGRIVFLYFVQKKGWLGASNVNYKDGLPDFIIRFFELSGGDETFYNNWLKELFFETLNRERKEDNFKMPDGKMLKVPFLNGGLFDKEGYDEHLLTFKSSLFHHADFEEVILTEKTKGNNRGFLDFLNAFNFTVHEDSLDEHTVAVDPEMLGHIFENLLEDNKDKGTYYTPKEIVHYMCQESLIEYLITHLSQEYTIYQPFGDNQIQLFGPDAGPRQLKIVEELGDKALNKVDVEFMVKNKDISQLNHQQLKKVDTLLDAVKICDPAIGSGAFPMGLLQEIFSIKEVIAYETGKDWKPAEVKERIIQNSIYGVDIEKGAVDIARLRFWLSLVVDEEKPRALPNLDYKIVVGDSLVSRFEGEIVEIDWDRKSSVGKADKYVQNVQRLLLEVAKKQKDYFHPESTNKKDLSSEIRDLKLDLLINQLSFNKEKYMNSVSEKGGMFPTAKDIKHNTERELVIADFENKIKRLGKLRTQKDQPFLHFDWKLDFPEILNPYLVSDDKKGFDIIIANPPYIKEYTNKSAFDGFRNSNYYQGKMDIWYGFACVMIDNLKEKGVECLIAQNNWITSHGSSILREKVLKESEIRLFTDFGDYKVFKTAGIQTMVYLIQKTQPAKEYKTKYSLLKSTTINKEQLGQFLSHTVQNEYAEKYDFLLKPEEFNGKTISFNTNSIEEILKKVENKGAFKLDEKEVAQGIVAPQDFLNKEGQLALGDTFSKGDGIFVLSLDEKEKMKLNTEESKLLKPYFTTAELQKYYGNPVNKYWIIYTDSEFRNVKKMSIYPKIKKHLDQFSEIITSDNRPYGLHRARDEKFFAGEKIISLRKCALPTFTYTDFACFVSQTFFIIKTNRINQKYLTALLNSTLMAFWFKYRGKMQGHLYQIDKDPLIQVPIAANDEEIIKQIEKLFDKVVLFQKENKDTTKIQAQIDVMIYALYNLTEKEINTILR